MDLQKIVDCCGDPIIVYAGDGRVTYVNPAFERVFGWSSGELVGQKLHFIPEQARNQTREAVDQILAGKAVSGMETVRKTKHRGDIPVRLSGSMLKTDDGNFNGMVVTLQDITDLVRSRQEADTANQAKSNFLSRVSREITTPMNGILGMLELLEKTALDAEQQEFVDVLQEAARSLADVIGDILDFSKIEAKEIDCTTIDFDLRTTMDEIKKILLPKAGRKGLGLVLSVHQQVPSLLKGDPEKLRQILTCLLANAVKFTDRGEVTGSVVILQENPTHAVLKFEVSDTGIGMEPDRLNTIFESFPGVPGSGAGKYGGTGIGLSIVSRLVHAMEGTIEVKSRPGKGTVFGITLNFEKQPALLNTQINIPRTIKGKKILIVDDDGAGRIILKEQLKKWGCLYDEAASAERALEKISSLLGSGRAYDIVLIDMQLPGMGGETLAGKIKSMPQGADMVLIMLSATGRRGDAARLEKTGVDGYLPKPPEASMLFNCITTALAMGNRKEKKIITRHLLREILKQRSGILMVELGSINRKMVKNILNKSGYTVGVAENRTRAGEIFKTGGFNIVLLEAGLVDREVFKTAEMIRRIEKESKLETTVIFVMADPGMTIETGPFVDEVIPKPVTADHLLGAMEKWRVRIQGDSDAGFRNSGSAGAREKKNIFNIDAALERAMEDKAFLEMLVNEFVRGLPEKLAAIKTSILKKDTGTLILQVHSLRGSALNLGAGGICSAALELEKKGDVGDLETIHEKFERLAREFHRFEDHIKTICWSDV